MRAYPGLKPWDLDRMTVDELQTLRADAHRRDGEGEL